MAFRWTIVGGTGYDVEDVDDPRTLEMTCPSCDKYVRFVEKDLIKNLRLFGVPLVGVEKGRRVFECPRCRVCVEPPEAELDAGDPAVETWREQLRKLEDDVRLWARRAQTAEDHREAELANEARQFQARAEREAERLRTKIERAGEHPPAERPKGPAIVARAGGAVVDHGADDAFQALKRRIAKREADAEIPTDAPPAPAPSPVVTAVTAAPSEEDEFAALRARLAQRPTNPEATAEPETPGADPLAALRSELAAPVEAAVVQADVPPAPPPDGTAPAAPAPPVDTDDDPVAALKRKLRGPR